MKLACTDTNLLLTIFFVTVIVSLFQLHDWQISFRILTWGDGYVNKMIKDTQIRDLYDEPIGCKNQLMSSTWCNNGQYQSYSLCPVEAALLNMSSHSYSLAEE